MKNKTVLLSLLLLINASAASAQSAGADDTAEAQFRIGAENPAARYCAELGYAVEIVDTPEGQAGYCIIKDYQGDVLGRFEEWAFMRGADHASWEYNFCGKNGLATMPGQEYATCVLKEPSTMSGQLPDNIGLAGKTVDQLLKISLKSTLYGGNPLPPQITLSGMEFAGAPDAGVQEIGNRTPPAQSDWRNRYGQNWLPPIRDRGHFCKSDWAFAIVSATETQYNIANENATLNYNLSEQYLLSDCRDQFGEHIGDCCGIYQNSILRAIAFVAENGTPDEGCMPYVDGAIDGCACSNYDFRDQFPFLWDPNAHCTNQNVSGGCSYFGSNDPYYQPPCSDRTCTDGCGDPGRIRKIDITEKVNNSNFAVKQAIFTYGPVLAAIGYGEHYNWTVNASGDDQYRCTLDTGFNHMVVLVGYNDTGQYYVVRDSAGTGAFTGGYFKLGYGECAVEQAVYKVIVFSSPHIDGIASPTMGNTSLFYNFTAEYRHPGGLMPLNIQVSVDGILHNMTEANASDTDPRDNKTYYATVQGLHFGLIDYYFTATDNFSHSDTSPTRKVLIETGWIDNCTMLQWMKYNRTGDNKTAGIYWLAQEIDCSASSTWNSGAGFEPVGDATPFDGILMGRGHAVTALTINRPSATYVGLFGNIGPQGEVYDVNLSSATVSGDTNVGGLFGYASGRVTNVSMTGQVTSGGSFAGCLGGWYTNNISGVNVSCVLSGFDHVGGVFGYSTGIVDSARHTGGSVGGTSNVGGVTGRNAGTLTKSYCLVNVSGSSYVGGIFGSNDGTVADCNYTLTVTCGGSDCGGIGGRNAGKVNNTAASQVTVNGGSYAGGLVGANTGVLANDSAISFVAATGSYAGGLVGTNAGTIVESFAVASVNSASAAGGLVGTNTGGILTSYSKGVANSTTDAGGLAGINGGVVNNSYSQAMVFGSSRTGGLVGQNTPTDGVGGIIKSSYASGAVSGVAYVGGLAGYVQFGNISDSFAAGSASGSSAVGGLVGWFNNTNDTYNTFIDNSYWNNASGNGMCGFGGCSNDTGRDQPGWWFDQTNTPMNVWDFATIWYTNNTSTPYFLWQGTQGNAAPTLTLADVDPLLADTLRLINFTVKYTDIDDEAPAYIRVVIDGAAEGMQNLSSGPYLLGVLYYYNATLPIGGHTYQFQASDGTNPVETALQTNLYVYESSPGCDGAAFDSVLWDVDQYTNCTDAAFLMTPGGSLLQVSGGNTLLLTRTEGYFNGSTVGLTGGISLDHSMLRFF
jgi:putative hemolysin